MKTLITYIALIICIVANAQSDKVNQLENQSDEVKKEWRKYVDNNLETLINEVRTLKAEVNKLKIQLETSKSDLKDIISRVGITIYKEEDLPKDLNKEEIGVAFVEDNLGIISIGVSFKNEWKFIKL